MLDNTAKLSDIISALQALQAINTKVDLAGVIGYPTQGTDTIAKIVQDVQNSKNTLANNLCNKGQSTSGAEPLAKLAAKVENIDIGKKWANGTINPTGKAEDMVTYTKVQNGYTQHFSTVTITGLSFKPSCIVIVTANAYGGEYNITVYSPFSVEYSGRTGNILAGCIRTNGIDGEMLVNQGDTIRNDGFKLPLRLGMGTPFPPHRWIAFE